MDKQFWKDGLRKFLVDGASVAIFMMVVWTLFNGIGSLYTSYYETGGLPKPEVFTSASAAFASATSFVFMLMLTRKYRVAEKEKVPQKASE
jgi:hypothetical protein